MEYYLRVQKEVESGPAPEDRYRTTYAERAPNRPAGDLEGEEVGGDVAEMLDRIPAVDD
jgi:hypothetical protein